MDMQDSVDLLRGSFARFRHTRSYKETAAEIGIGQQTLYWFAIGYQTPKLALLQKIEWWCEQQRQAAHERRRELEPQGVEQ